MPGFQTHPDRNNKFGYRSKYLLNGGSAISKLSYNGYHFPPGIRSRVTAVPEYDKSGRVVKWITLALQIEFIFTDPREDPHELTTEGTYGQITYTSARDLTARLSQNGQMLCFDAQGLGGTYRINDPAAGSVQIRDLDMGPKPQVVEMQPLGGGSAWLVQWLCVTRISPLQDNYNGDFVSFNYGSEWTYDEAGFMTRTITGEFEFETYQNTDVNAEQSKRVGWHTPYYNGDLAKARKYILEVFPYLSNFLRRLEFAFNESKSLFTFKIIDTEKKTDSIFPPGVADFDLKENLTADYQTAFTKWTLTYTGTITAVNDSSEIYQSKSLAWFWLWQILRTKRIHFQNLMANLPTPVLKQFSDAAGKSFDWTFTPAQSMKKSYFDSETPKELTRDMVSILMYPIYISFTDDKYGNEIDFTVSYRVFCTTNLLLRGLNIFQPVGKAGELPGQDRSSWVRYLTQQTPFPTGKDSAAPILQQEILVDICNPLLSAPPTGEESAATGGGFGEDAGLLDMTRPKNGRDYETYANKFQFYEEHKRYTGSILQPRDKVETTEYESGIGIVNGTKPKGAPGPSEFTLKPYSGLPGPPSSESGTLENMIISAPTETIRYVIMEGVAERFSGPIAPPVMLAVGNAVAYQDSTLGMDVVETEVIKTGLVDSDGVLCDMFRTRWKKHYVLGSKPDVGSVFTTGIPRRFS